MRVTVLLGGPSDERSVSLVSGRAVAEALRACGHEVFESDVSASDLSGLDHPADVIFPVLHGKFGEDGQLQEILEKRDLPFVGSGSAASRTAMDKDRTKQAWQRAGLPTAPWEVLTKDRWDGQSLPARVKPACVVKPVDSGSSIDVSICQTNGQVRNTCRKLVDKYGAAMVEKFIKGAEITVGVLEEEALPAIRIETPRGIYDNKAKYDDPNTQYHFDTGLPAEVVQRCGELAVRAHKVLGCRDLSRVDMIVDGANEPQLLEINTIPGFTARSLLPKAAAHAGIEFGQLVDRLAHIAAQRQAQRAVSCCG
jgi:D-alanine-D-alanine ligase